MAAKQSRVRPTNQLLLSFPTISCATSCPVALYSEGCRVKRGICNICNAVKERRSVARWRIPSPNLVKTGKIGIPMAKFNFDFLVYLAKFDPGSPTVIGEF